MSDPEITGRKILIAVVCLLGASFIPYVQAIIAPLMMLPMIKEFGWTRTEYTLATTFMFVCGAITVLLFGRMADRYGPRSILLLGAVCGGATMLLLSQQGAQLWRLYLAYALLGAFGSSGLGYTKIIGTLFARHRGKALAVFGAESTLALATLPLLTNALISQAGWRGTYVVYALIMLAIAPILYFAIRGPGLDAPAQSAQPRPGADASAPPVVLEGLTPAQIRHDRIFWLVVATSVLGRGINVGLMAHIIPAITDKGFTAGTAAAVFSAGTFVGLAGTLLAGLAMDYFRTARIMAVFGLMYALGVLLFAVASTGVGGLPLLIAGLGTQQVALAAMLPGTTYLHTRFVGMRSFGEAFAMQVVIQGVAMGVTPPLFGLIFDRTGSYAPAYWLMLAGALLGAGIYLLLGPYRYRAEAARVR